MVSNILLLRHGITFDKLRKGKQNAYSKLSAIGFNQITIIGDYILSANIDVDVIFSSPTQRAIESALIIKNKLDNNYNTHKQLISDISLKEIYFENFNSDLIRVSVKKRFEELMKKLADFNNVLLVSHASFIRLFTFYLITNNFNDDSDTTFSFLKKTVRIGNGALIYLKRIDNKQKFFIYKVINIDLD